MTKKRVFHICVECDPIHIDNCTRCFGYGFHKGTRVPVSASEVKELTEGDNCPECLGTLTNDALYKIRKDDLEFLDAEYVFG